MQSASEPSGAAISSRSSRFQDVNRSTSSLDSAVESINSGDEAVVERSPSRSPSVPSTHFDFSESDAGPPSYNQQPPDSMSRQHSLTALEQENAELRERLATLEKNVSSRLGASGSSGTGNTSTNCAQGENEGLEDETERLRSQLEDAEQRLAALVAVHRRENLELEERISKLSLTEEPQTGGGTSSGERPNGRSEIDSLKQDRKRLLKDKENCLRINRNLSTELERLRSEFEEHRADNEMLRARVIEFEEELKHHKEQMRETENERRATARTCNMLAEEKLSLKEKNQELEEMVLMQTQTIEELQNESASMGEIKQRAQECNCLENGILRALELEHEQTRKKLQECTAELRTVQGQQTSVRQKCDDLRDEVHTLRLDNTKTMSFVSRENNAWKTWGAVAGPSGVNQQHSLRFGTIGKPLEIAYTREDELIQMVRGLNEQTEVIATTIVSLTDSDKPANPHTPGNAGVDTHTRNRLQDILGDDLFQNLQMRTQQDTFMMDLHEVAWAIQAALSYLLSVFARSWPQPPPLLLEDQMDRNKWQRKYTVGKQRESNLGDHRVRTDMISTTLLLIDEILALSGLISVCDLEEARQGINQLWNEAEKVAGYLKESSKDASYELLLATPGEAFDSQRMALDESDLSEQSIDSRVWMIVVLCTKALGLERVSKSGRINAVLEKTRIAQSML